MKVKLDEVYIGHKTNEVPLGPGVVEVDEELGEYLVSNFVWAKKVRTSVSSDFGELSRAVEPTAGSTEEAKRAKGKKK